MELKEANEVKAKNSRKKSDITYQDILEGIDILYQTLPNKVKETIVLQNEEASRKKLSFDVIGLKLNYSYYNQSPYNDIIYYLYDLTGLIGLKYKEKSHYYIKNLQEDIIGILDKNYNKIVTYEYDSWDKLLSIKDEKQNEITDETHIGIINPFRYREYYYDTEIGLYYLNSRYYHPT